MLMMFQMAQDKERKRLNSHFQETGAIKSFMFYLEMPIN